MSTNVKIVVVDTGVFTTHKLLKKYDNISGISIKFENGEIVLSDDFTDTYGHGTSINQIIKSHCTDCEIFNIKLFEVEEIEEYEPIKTLEYIYNNIDCDILNLSLGICVVSEYEKLYSICEKIKQKGIIIVSAFDNNGALSYPASFDNVIGVSNGDTIKRANNYTFNDSKIINIFSYGSVQRLAWINPELLMIGGNSFACPHITGIIANILNEKKLNFNELLCELREKASNVITYNIYRNDKINNKYFDIKKAIIFPFNKEMHSLIRYYDILKFDIIDVYDTKYSFNVSASTRHLLKDKNVKDLIVKNYDNIDFDSLDTIIIGHTDELSSLINKTELKKEIIIKALNHQKNIYSFDDLEEYSDIISSINYRFSMIKILYTDRGLEFKNKAIQDILNIFGIKRSLSKKGCPYDNAVAEANLKIIKVEFIYFNTFNTIDELSLKLFDYINWYNNCRTHSSLGYLTPIVYKYRVRLKVV